MLRVLHLINGLNVGGAEGLLVETLRHVDPMRFDVRVASLLGRGALAPTLEELQVPVIDLSKAGRFTFRCLGQLREVVASQGFDLVHAHLAQATLVARWLRRRGGIPHLISSQHFPPSEGGGLVRRLHRMTAHWDDVTVAVSPSIRDELLRNPKLERVVTIENGIDVRRFTPDGERIGREDFGIGDGDFAVGFVGRLVPEKNLATLLGAMTKLSAESPATHLLLAGEGPEQGELARLVSTHRLEGRVHFLGTLGEPELLLRALDAFCLPSRRETFGLSAAEAMAVGCPVVHSAVGGLATLTEDGVSGLHVADHTDPNAFADALRRVRDDANLRACLRDHGIQRVRERFSIREKANEMMALWEESVGAPEKQA